MSRLLGNWIICSTYIEILLLDAGVDAMRSVKMYTKTSGSFGNLCSLCSCSKCPLHIIFKKFFMLSVKFPASYSRLQLLGDVSNFFFMPILDI